MKRLSYPLALFAVGLLIVNPASAETKTPKQQQILSGTDPMPSLVRHPDFRKPVFVGAHRVLTKDGKVVRRLFRRGNARLIEQSLAKDPTGGCVELDLSSSSDYRDPRGQSLARSVSESDNVLVGTVTGLVAGFLETRPGTLVRFETREVLKGKARAKHFVFFPAGDFRVGQVDICARSSYFPETPHLGDGLLVLFDDSRLSERTDIIFVRSSDVVSFHRGSAKLPMFFQEASPELLGLSEERFVDHAREASRSKKVDR